jgi:WD40 repeat protein
MVNPAHAAVFDGSDNCLAIAGGDSVIRIFDSKKGQWVAMLERHEDSVNDVICINAGLISLDRSDFGTELKYRVFLFLTHATIACTVAR